MKTNITLPADFYQQLYDKIMGYEFEPENEDDGSRDIEEIQIGNFWVSVRATFEVEYIDDSFDHAFGTEYGYHFEAGDLESIEDVVIYHYDEDDNETEVSDLFDEDYFWNQFKRYGVVSKGVQIHYGDEVVVKTDSRYGAWEKMIYLYTDTRLGVHVCVKSLRKPYLWKKQFKHILPATTGALMIVGKTGYHLHTKA